jgi:hypothetical protein
MFRATIALAAALVAVPVALASHPSWFLDRKVNADTDRALERVVAEYDPSFDHKVERAEIAVVDRCAGREARHMLAPTGRALDRETILRSSSLGRPGVVFAMKLQDQSWIARVVQLRVLRKGACPRPVAIFSYSSKRPPYAPPEEHWVGGVSVEPGEHSAAYAGKELVLVERYASRQLNPVQLTRTTYFRYSPARRGYVAYKTELSPKAFR